MKKLFRTIMLAPLWLSACSGQVDLSVDKSENDLVFENLAQSWDEGMPLGNAVIGANVWQKDGNLRLAIDRIDLWDLRPIDSLGGDNFKFSWVKEQLDNGTYHNVQKKLDEPYDRLPAPSKIPGAAIEFNVEALGEVAANRLHLKNGLLEVTWETGARFRSFVHANEPVGWFVFEGVDEGMVPKLITPRYQSSGETVASDPVTGQDVRRLEYTQGNVIQTGNRITYHQKGYGDDYYDAAIEYTYKNNVLTGTWSLTSSISDRKAGYSSDELSAAAHHVSQAMQTGISKQYASHNQWWNSYWDRSSIHIPNKIIEKQYYNELYKFGCSSRENSSIIPLQSVWTADNGLLPPWKGDVHHDLNTELSYWPAYAGNLCDVGMSFINTLWEQREVNRRYTKTYFGVEGLNVPGVCTLTGEPMGGWIQYAMSPTVSAWLAQHFYLHWQFTMDDQFLKSKGYPYVREVAVFLENITSLNEDGQRVLPISSSPEIFDNSPKAWFRSMTNYDLALVWGAFDIAAQMARATGAEADAQHWTALKEELPPFELDETGALMFARGVPYNESHRHFSNAIGIMPLSVFDVTRTEEEKRVVKATISQLDEMGSSYWVGYSFSWLANMKARAFDAKGTEEALETFASCFILRNGFHANGDQSKSGKSSFTYRPFTLEGNFAFAAGVQEMLLQSHTGVVRIFPATPDDWNDVAFDNLRARGAFLVSASKKGGVIESVSLLPEVDGTLLLENPFKDREPEVSGGKIVSYENNIYTIQTQKGNKVVLK